MNYFCVLIVVGYIERVMDRQNTTPEDKVQPKPLSNRSYLYMRGVIDRVRALVAHATEAQEGRWFHWMAVCFVFGAAAYFALPWEPAPHDLWIPSIGAFMIWLNLRERFIAYRLMGLVTAALFGLALAQWNTNLNDTVLLKDNLRPLDIQGTITHTEPVEHGWRITLNQVTYPGSPPERSVDYPHSVRLTVRQDGFNPVKGAVVSTRATLMAPSSSILPGSYDFRRHAFYERIGAYGYTIDHVRVLQEPDLPIWQKMISRYRQHVVSTVREWVDPEQAGIMIALLTGQKKAIPDSQVENMRHAGLAHLLAISGLHVGLIAGILFFAIRYLLVLNESLALEYPVKKWSAALTILLSTLYTLLVGASVSTQRALIMTALVLLAVMVDRVALTLRTVAVAAFIIVALAPHSVIHPGFQMSFMAVTGLIAFYETYKRNHRFNKLNEMGWYGQVLIYLGGVIVTTVIATLATLPASVYHFQQVAIWGVLANMLAMPLMAFWIMPLVLLSLIVCFFGSWIAQFPLYLLAIGIARLQEIAALTASLDGAIWRLPLVPPAIFILAVIGFLVLCLMRGLWPKLGGGFLIMVAIILMVVQDPPDIVIPADRSFTGIVVDDMFYLTEKGSGFTRDLAMRAVGVTDYRLMRDGAKEHSAISCDPAGCIYRLSEKRTVAFPNSTESALKDCRRSDDIIFVSGSLPRDCNGDVTIDFFDLYYNGGVMLRYEDPSRTPLMTWTEIRPRPWNPKIDQ